MIPIFCAALIPILLYLCSMLLPADTTMLAARSLGHNPLFLCLICGILMAGEKLLCIQRSVTLRKDVSEVWKG